MTKSKQKKANKPKGNKRNTIVKTGPTKKSGLQPASFQQPVRLGGQKLNVPRKIAHHKAACSVLDPFCIHARNAQRPDGTVSASIPFQLRCITTYPASGTNGANVLVYYPNPFYQSLGPASYAAPTWTMSATSTASAYNTTALNVLKAFRVVSFGLIARCTMTTATAKGTVVANTAQQIPYGGAITQGSMVSGEYEIMTLAAGQVFTWISKPIGPTAHEMVAKTVWNSNTYQPQWTACMINVSGGDLTSGIEYMSVELVLNIEGVVDDTGTYGVFQKPAPAPNQLAIQAANTAQTAAASFTHGVMENASKKLSSAATSAMDSILSEGMALFAGFL